MGLIVLKIRGLHSLIHPLCLASRRFSLSSETLNKVSTMFRLIQIPIVCLYIQGSARQLFQRLQGPMEEDTLKSHFEKICLIGKKLHYRKTQVGSPSIFYCLQACNLKLLDFLSAFSSPISTVVYQ